VIEKAPAGAFLLPAQLRAIFCGEFLKESMRIPKRYEQIIRLVLCGLVLLASPVFAADKVLDASSMASKPLSLTAHFAVLEDPSRALSLADVQQPNVAARFTTDQAPATALGLGFTQSAYWLRLTLRNTADQVAERMLEIDTPRISSIEVHLPMAQGSYQSVHTGADVPFATRPYPNRNFVFPVTLPAHSEQVIYMRMESTVGLLIPAQLWTPQAFHAYERNDYLGQAWYFGMATAMVLFNLLLFLALRDSIYLLYVSFVGCTVVTLAIKNGLAPEFLWPGTALGSNVSYYIGTSISLGAFLLFMRRMLRTAEVVPRLDVLVQWLVGVYLLTLVGYAWSLPTFARYGIVLNLATTLLIFCVGLICAFKRQRSAYFFLAAFVMLMLGGALTTLRAMGVVPTNAFTVDGVQLGSALEMLLLAFALADRFNVIRREKARAQSDLLQVQLRLVDTLKTSEQVLEQRVAQRTDELQVLNSKLEAMSMTDGLTGIANRRRLDDVLAQEWRRAQRLGHPLVLAMLDVDWFKKYNDYYGHPAGDECLRQIARVLGSTICRTSDLVARYGGEEFVFIAPATDAASAQGMGRRVCEAVQALGLPHAMSAFGCVTVSVGVAVMTPGPGNSPEALLKSADDALYRAKEQGRNRAVFAQETP
jgi:diguanylate cyclase (GGDEF)-like protein